MHPAYSVIVFTVASGAGFGLLAWLAFSVLTVPPASSAAFYTAAFGVAFGLAIVGLLASTLHLGRPERAWRAFSQWRTSWLSREGVAAVVALGSGGLLALAAVFDWPYIVQAPLALPTLLSALATVWCTGMIYESLPTIRAWSHWLTTEVYLVLSVASGALLITALLAVFGHVPPGAVWTTIVLLALGGMMKALYWRGIDRAPRTSTAGSATGLGAHGKVRPLLEAHTEANYVMRDMGFVVARKHGQKLRLIALGAAFGLPIVLLLAMLAVPVLAPIFAVLAVMSAAVGLMVERWLFFAQAQHVVTLFYGAAVA